MARALVTGYRLSDLTDDTAEFTVDVTLFGTGVPGGAQGYTGTATIDLGAPVTAAAVASALAQAASNAAAAAGITLTGGLGVAIVVPAFTVS